MAAAGRGLWLGDRERVVKRLKGIDVSGLGGSSEQRYRPGVTLDTARVIVLNPMSLKRPNLTIYKSVIPFDFRP